MITLPRMIRFGLLATMIGSTAVSARAQLPVITGVDPVDTTMRYDITAEHQKMDNRDEREVINLQGDIAIHDYMRLRLSVPYINLEYRDDTPDTGFESQNGVGDLSAELLYKALVTGPDTLACGLRISLDTATEDELGQGGHTITPIAMWSRKCVHDMIVAPVLEWTYGSDMDTTPYHPGGDVSELRLRTVVAWEPMLPEVSWLLAEPGFAVDFGDEDDRSFELGVEYGLMFSETMAFFARPTVTSGDHDLDWSFLVGFRHTLREWVLFE